MGSHHFIKIPEALNAIYIILSETFPDGMNEEHYWAVLYLLYDYMCDENLSLIMSILAKKEFGLVMNDVYKVGEKGFEVDSELLKEIKNRLDIHGFEDWKKAE